jgi:hypothetical protein
MTILVRLPWSLCAPALQAWCQSITEGRNYASDGYSHLLDFTVDAVRMGENGSELRLPAGGKTVTVKVTACAMLGEVSADCDLDCC